MAQTTGFGKLEREMLSNNRLPPDVRVALIEFKNQLRVGRGLVPFGNREGGLPATAAGQVYYEHQVGQAHAGDPEPRGKRRLVGLVDAGHNLLKVYFSDRHYTLGNWMQLQYP
jgi:guanyl-specific ribonuclease Sa